jgi:DNA excision repair protein ERCC-2
VENSANISAKCQFTISVRHLIEFELRQGGLGGKGDFVSPERAQQGTRGHQRAQRSRPEGYQPEVALDWEAEQELFRLKVQGRVDGLFAEADPPWLEEIKTVRERWDGIPEPLHWAQLRFYGWMHALRHRVPRLRLQLTYLEMDSGREHNLSEVWRIEEIEAFCRPVIVSFLEWLERVARWRSERDGSIEALNFPFAEYRAGQRELMVAVYRTFKREGRLFVEAPTGAGKTISALFPAIKALEQGVFERVFFLTAKGSGVACAQTALDRLRQAGLRVRSVQLRAREKICLGPGQPCDLQTCPFATQYYDRVRPALEAALEEGNLTAETLKRMGEQHQVCPHQLALDCSDWADVIIGDYNYAFDPRVFLRRHFGEGRKECALLIDEAHNLVERAREMYSAELAESTLRELREALGNELQGCAKLLDKLLSAMKRLARPVQAGKRKEGGKPGEFSLFAREERGTPLWAGLSNGVMVSKILPEKLLVLIDLFMKEAEKWLVKNEPASFRQNLLDLYFQMGSFLQVANLFDERYCAIAGGKRAGRTVRLFCLDPSSQLRNALERGRSAIFFSGTLTPLEYFREILGGNPEDGLLQFQSSFPPEHLGVFVHEGISTAYAGRQASGLEVAEAISKFIRTRPGNYLVFFPSYEYLDQVLRLFSQIEPDLLPLAQRRGMNESEREQFLAQFSAQPTKSRIGFAVMGGIFGETIDLEGERLSGAVIVGVGLPQVNLERELIRAWFEENRGAGFDFAYTFPGFNRVCQAAGRVIRSETDHGAVLLIDRRFAQGRYQRLFPAWWKPIRTRSTQELKGMVEQFWNGFALQEARSGCCGSDQMD